MIRPGWCWKDVTISGVDGNPNGMWFGSGSNEGPGYGDEVGRFFQNVASVLFHALLINEKKFISLVSKSESDFKGSKMVIHSFMQHIFYWVPMCHNLPS